MPGTKQGGIKAATTNKARYGEAFYEIIGSKGGRVRGPKGFALNRELASIAGRKGGRASRRGKATKIKVEYQDGDWMPDLKVDPITTDNKRHMKVMPF